MNESLRLEQVQRQQQRLNPQSVALGRVLEMSEAEFDDEIRRELDDNPALEVVDNKTSGEADDSNFGESAEDLQRADYANDDDIPSYLRSARNSSPDDVHFEAASIAADDSRSIGEILMERLSAENELSPYQLRIAAYIIGNIDSNGYMRRPVAAIADDISIAEGLDTDTADVQQIFDLVRSLDPAGIGAVDLRDCLLLQLKRLSPDQTSGNARIILQNHFDLFSKKHYERIMAVTGMSQQAIESAIALIRTLNPKPASALESACSADATTHVSPDFILDYDPESDTFHIQLAGNVPELAIESSFRVDDAIPTKSRDARQAFAFIKKKRDDATAFIRLVEMRAATLMSIAKALVKGQHDFLVSGDKADLRPLLQRDIAAATGVDISVVSRATSGKYMLTPHGMYPVKLLFNEARHDDTDLSAHAILKALGEIIEAEDKRRPLPDEALCARLKELGYNVARRTVAKYRESLGIPVARLRRTGFN